jgi:hypothetical protein
MNFHEKVMSKLNAIDDPPQSGGIHIDIDSHKMGAGDESGFDSHATDPRKLNFDEKVEKKLAKAKDEQDAEIKYLRELLKQFQEIDPDDISGKQKQIKEKLKLLK